MFRLDDLARSFGYFASDGRDHGINVRHRWGLCAVNFAISSVRDTSWLTGCFLRLLQLLCGQAEASLDLTNRLFFCSGKVLISVQNLAPDRTNTQHVIWSRAGAIHSLLRHPEQLAAERAQHTGKRQALGLNPASPLGFGGGAGYDPPGGFFHGVKVRAYAIRLWRLGFGDMQTGGNVTGPFVRSPCVSPHHTLFHSTAVVGPYRCSKHVRH